MVVRELVLWSMLSMRAILHIGRQKTGSSAIQEALFQGREKLADEGVLYPTPPKGWTHHNIVVVNMLRPGKEPRYLLDKAERDELVKINETFWEQVSDEVSSRNPEVLVISAESLFRNFNESALSDLKERVKSLGANELKIVGYVRRHSDHFASATIQKLKARFHVPKPSVGECRPILQKYMSVFGREYMDIAAFSRASLYGQDIVADFLSRSVQDHEKLANTLELGRSDVNVGLSAEAAEIIRKYRGAFDADKEDRHTRRSADLRRALERIEKNSETKNKPRLRQSIRQWLDYSTTDLCWLRQEFDVAFPGYEYGKAGSLEGEAPPDASCVEDIYEYDKTEEIELLRALKEAEWASNEIEAKWTDETLSACLQEVRADQRVVQR